jgi:hypothetical protein
MGRPTTLGTRPGALAAVGILVMLALGLGGCGSAGGPEASACAFLTAVNEGKSDQALDLVCGDIALPGVAVGVLSAPTCDTLDNNGSVAHVRVRAELRWAVPPIKKSLDYTATMQMDRGKWCMAKESFGEIWKSLTTIN